MKRPSTYRFAVLNGGLRDIIKFNSFNEVTSFIKIRLQSFDEPGKCKGGGSGEILRTTTVKTGRTPWTSRATWILPYAPSTKDTSTTCAGTGDFFEAEVMLERGWIIGSFVGEGVELLGDAIFWGIWYNTILPDVERVSRTDWLESSGGAESENDFASESNDTDATAFPSVLGKLGISQTYRKRSISAIEMNLEGCGSEQSHFVNLMGEACPGNFVRCRGFFEESPSGFLGFDSSRML